MTPLLPHLSFFRSNPFAIENHCVYCHCVYLLSSIAVCLFLSFMFFCLRRPCVSGWNSCGSVCGASGPSLCQSSFWSCGWLWWVWWARLWSCTCWTWSSPPASTREFLFLSHQQWGFPLTAGFPSHLFAWNGLWEYIYTYTQRESERET